MGYNSAILILNDAIGDIDNDPKAWWDSVRQAIQGGGISLRGVKIVPAGNRVNGSTLFHMDHADFCGVYIVGGNHVTKLGKSCQEPTGGHHTIEGQIAILRDIADQLGYRLVKIGKKP